MIIICGKTIAEVERDLEMAKRAIATGAPMDIGGATMADVEQAMRGLRSAVGADNAPIDNPNYTAPCGRCCDCDCDPMYEMSAVPNAVLTIPIGMASVATNVAMATKMKTKMRN